MKRDIFSLMFFISLSAAVLAQKVPAEKVKLYNPVADAKAVIKAAVKRVAKEGKHVSLQIGGNWCGWCILFIDKVARNDTLRAALEKNFVTQKFPPDWTLAVVGEEHQVARGDLSPTLAPVLFQILSREFVQPISTF